MKQSPKKLEGVPLGGRIRELRLLKGWSIRELAKHAEVWYSYLHAVESRDKSNPSVAMMMRLAKALGVSLDDLVCGGGDAVPGEQPAVWSIDRVTSNAEIGSYVQMRLKFDDGRWVDAVATVEDFGLIVTGMSEVPVRGRIREMRKPKGVPE